MGQAEATRWVVVKIGEGRDMFGFEKSGTRCALEAAVHLWRLESGRCAPFPSEQAAIRRICLVV
jgi:hypothetical protein